MVVRESTNLRLSVLSAQSVRAVVRKQRNRMLSVGANRDKSARGVGGSANRVGSNSCVVNAFAANQSAPKQSHDMRAALRTANRCQYPRAANRASVSLCPWQSISCVDGKPISRQTDVLIANARTRIR